MSKPSARQGWLHTLGLATLLFCAVAVVSIIPVVHEFQLRLADTYFRTAPPVRRQSAVVLVVIDDQSLHTYGRWPWSRATVAQLVRQLDKAGARIIGLDILFAEPQSTAADAQLADAIRASRRAVLAAKIGSYPDGPRWIEPIPVLANAALGLGHSQAVLDDDGICRRFPLRELTVDGPRLAFALEIARHISPVQAAQFMKEYGVAESDSGSPLMAAPVLAPIAFRREAFDAISAADVLGGRGFAMLRGRPVLVGFGPTEIADRLNTPLTGQLPAPGVEIHAQILDGILGSRHLRALPRWISALLLFAACVGAITLFRNRRGWRIIVLALCYGTISYSVGWAIFVLQSRIPPVGPMLLAVIFGPVVVYAADFAVLERSVRRQVTGLRRWLLQQRRYTLGDDSDDIAHSLDLLQELQTQLGALYELHERLLDASHDAVGIFDASHTLILQNANFQKLFRSHARVTMLEDIMSILEWGEDAKPDSLDGEAEARVAGELFSLRRALLPSTTLSPAGGTIWMLSSLQAREERDRARAEVLGFITHELRTPLTAIQGFSELMMQFPGSPHSARAPETIFRESKRLLALIHSYLDVLRLDAGAHVPIFEPLRLGQIVQQVFEVLGPIAAAAEMSLSWQGDDVCVLGDPSLLEGAVLNVVSNAIKYGDKGTQVTVGCALDDHGVTVAVHNFGRPIDSRHLPHLFSPYYRGASAGERAPGWGLGLAFVKRIAEKHGGRVSVESSEDGTMFRIHLPAGVPLTESEVAK